MTIEVLGMVSTSHGSESVGWQGGPVVDVDYLTKFAQAHDRSGFDRILVAHGASSPDGFAVAAHVLYNTERAGVLIAHRPGFVAPTHRTARRFDNVFASDCALIWFTAPSPFASFQALSLFRSREIVG